MHTFFRTYVGGVGSEILKKGVPNFCVRKEEQQKAALGPRAAWARLPPRDSAVHRTRATTPAGDWGRGPCARHEGPWIILWSSYSRGCSVFVRRGRATPTIGGHAGGPGRPIGPDDRPGREATPTALSGGTPGRLTWQKGRPTDPGASGPHTGFRSRQEGGGGDGHLGQVAAHPDVVQGAEAPGEDLREVLKLRGGGRGLVGRQAAATQRSWGGDGHGRGQVGPYTSFPPQG